MFFRSEEREIFRGMVEWGDKGGTKRGIYKFSDPNCRVKFPPWN